MFPWYSFLTYAVITAATPGPNNIRYTQQSPFLQIVNEHHNNPGYLGKRLRYHRYWLASALEQDDY